MKVTEIQPTPNPNALKFMLDGPCSDAPISFFNAASAADHPLARTLFAVDGVASLLLLGDFLTVNKQPDTRWEQIIPAVKKIIESC